MSRYQVNPSTLHCSAHRDDAWRAAMTGAVGSGGGGGACGFLPTAARNVCVSASCW